ncbi:MAG: depupylase/deamidase Dop [Actinomycetota bacterium]|nr:depupylase/deamidase Dop [Actinomycetota bacterium]MDA3003701.1 depupylase/deamidase Dop [Actinomycetota bacterium]
MSIAKVLGIETEYGIISLGVDSSPVTSSSLLINSYVSRFDSTIGWDFVAEKPGVDARGFSLDDVFPQDIEMNMVNTVLTNGARYYVDHAHPEVSTPECRTASEAVLFDRAGEEIIRQSMLAAKRVLPDGAELVAYKNNSDGKGNSYGCHENYLLSRAVPFGEMAALITTHFVTRQIFCGAGKVGSEFEGMPNNSVPFQLSQRADFFEEEIGLETTLKRPIINTRDEPHCDPTKYRRLHVIVGDANMSEVATFLKLGTTAILLSMIEDEQFEDDLVLATPVSAIRQVSHDPTLKQKILLDSGKTYTALNLQEILCERAEKYADRFGLESVGEEDGKLILSRWREALEGLRQDPSTMSHVIDWVAKKRIVDGIAERYELRANDPRLKAIDLQYHDMRAEKCLALRAGLETMTNAEDVARATTTPPETTRAYFRGMCLKKWPADVVAANWDSVVFDIGRDPLRRVPMMEPLRGTRELTERLLAQSSTPAELVAALGDQVSPSNFKPTN